MKKIILMCFILISFSAVKAQCDYVITQENCKINIKCNNQLIRQLNAKEVLVWQKGGYYIYLSDGITSWSQPMFNIDNYDTVSTLIDSVTVWQILCGGTGSIFLDNQQISISGDTVYLERGGFAVLPESSGGGTDDQQLSKSNDTIYLEDGGFVVVPSLHQGNGIQLKGDTLIVGSDTVIITGGGAQTLTLLTKNDTSQSISISGGNTIALDIRDLDSDATNEIQTLSKSNDTIYLEDGGFVVLPSSEADTINVCEMFDIPFWGTTVNDSIYNGIGDFSGLGYGYALLMGYFDCENFPRIVGINNVDGTLVLQSDSTIFLKTPKGISLDAEGLISFAGENIVYGAEDVIEFKTGNYTRIMNSDTTVYIIISSSDVQLSGDVRIPLGGANSGEVLAAVNASGLLDWIRMPIVLNYTPTDSADSNATFLARDMAYDEDYFYIKIEDTTSGSAHLWRRISYDSW